MANERVRKVKLHSKYRASAKRDWVSNYSGKEVPWLNVSGVWLERAGFKVGDAVEITVGQNTLIIKNRSANAFLSPILLYKNFLDIHLRKD